MANTIIVSGNVIEITDIDSDWSWYDTLVAYATSKTGIPIHSIQFKPIATGDRCVIKNGSAAAASVFDKAAATAYDDKELYFHGEEIKPFLDVGDGSYSAGAKVIITLSTKGK